MQQNTRNLSLELENIGCLKHIEIVIKRGLNVVLAPNASGKTSLIRALISMFSKEVPPEHLLTLGHVKGRIEVQFGGKRYEKNLNRNPDGSVKATGTMLPFSDDRAFKACVALAEIGVVHRITGGGNVFREYLESLSYGGYYNKVIQVAQELLNELSRELASSTFKRFESLPTLLADLTDLHIRKNQVENEIKFLKANREKEIDEVRNKIKEESMEITKEEMSLQELRRNLVSEKEKEQQLGNLIELTEESSRIASQIKKEINDSKNRKKEILDRISEKMDLIKDQKRRKESLDKMVGNLESENIEGLEKLGDEFEHIRKDIILKEEEIQNAESFPSTDPKYASRLVIEVRKETLAKISWLNDVSDFFQEMYMRRMTVAILRFNKNIINAFKELGLMGFENIFLDQNFALHIIRERGIRQPIDTLSASEKLTVSLMMMLAARDSFVSDFPLFIIDELTLSYDPEKFDKIVAYLKHRVPFVIVTKLTAEKTGKPKVLYNI